MFSRIFCRNTNIPTQNPVEPPVQGNAITEPTVVQSSGGKKKQSNQSEDGAVSKYFRFAPEPENIENEWNLLTQLASYVNKYMSTHISEKGIS